MMPKSRNERFLALLQKLQAMENNDPAAIAEFEARSWNMSAGMQFNDREHKDIKVLFNQGLIESTRHLVNPYSIYNPIGIYDYRLSADGRAYLTQNEQATEDPNPTNVTPKIFIIHGTDKNGIVPQVMKVCQMLGAAPFRMIDQPSLSQAIPDKLANLVAQADYFIAVLTADETIEGTKRARPNASGEAIGVIMRDKNLLLALLVEDGVEVPSNLQGLERTSLTGDWITKLENEFAGRGITK